METTLLKGLAVLEALIARGKPCGVSDLAVQLKLSKSNTHRLLNTLVAAGFVTVEDGHYTASLKSWELGIRVMGNFDVRTLARPIMEEVARTTSEGVRLAILDRTRLEAVLVDTIESCQAVRAFTELGARLPAYCTASGKALLAYQDNKLISSCSRRLKPLTRWTITNPQEFIRHLEKVRRDGFVMSLREFSAQVNSIGAPIFAPDGSVIASVSIAAPVERMSPATMRKYTQTLCRSADQISAAMRSPSKVVDLYKRLSAPRAMQLPHRSRRRVQARS